MDNSALAKRNSRGEPAVIEAQESPLWSQCLSALRTRISESALNTWFSALEIVELGASELVLSVPNGFVLEYVVHHYRGIIERTLEEVAGRPMAVSFTVHSRAPHLEVFQAEGRSGESRTGGDGRHSGEPSLRGSAFAERVCQLCADICAACGEECAKFEMDHCQQCADACRRCAEACRAMAGTGARHAH